MSPRVFIPHSEHRVGDLVYSRTINGSVIWTDEMDQAVRKGIEARWSMSKIAASLGLSRNSVIGRVWRLNNPGVSGKHIRKGKQ